MGTSGRVSDAHEVGVAASGTTTDPKTMVKYAREPANSTKSAKAKCTDLRVHFKNTRESAMAIKKMGLLQAKQYLEDVLEHKRCIVFRRFCGGVGRTAQATSISHCSIAFIKSDLLPYTNTGMSASFASSTNCPSSMDVSSILRWSAASMTSH